MLPRLVVGNVPNDGKGESLRSAAIKINQAFDILDGILASSREIKNSDFLPENGKLYLVSTSLSPVKVTLPANPVDGFVFELIDHEGLWGTNNVLVVANGMPVNGTVADVTLNTNFQRIRFRWIGYNIGWVTE